MQQQRILFVLTGHDRLGDAGDTSADKTGFHLAEAARPWQVLTDAGYEVDLATPRGGRAPIDPGSRDMDDEDNAKFLGDPRVKQQLENTRSLRDVDVSGYDAIYFPGGHGTMWDLPDDEAVQKTVRTMYEDGKIVAAVCHGPAALVNVRLSNGGWLVDGKTMSVFTDAEEKAVDKDTVVPFLLASRLEEHGAKIDGAANFEKSVSVDGRLITGQNPASARELGEKIRDLLDERRARAA
jgi:putative intracellular protease/amidase